MNKNKLKVCISLIIAVLVFLFSPLMYWSTQLISKSPDMPLGIYYVVALGLMNDEVDFINTGFSKFDQNSNGEKFLIEAKDKKGQLIWTRKIGYFPVETVYETENQKNSFNDSQGLAKVSIPASANLYAVDIYELDSLEGQKKHYCINLRDKPLDSLELLFYVVLDRFN